MEFWAAWNSRPTLRISHNIRAKSTPEALHSLWKAQESPNYLVTSFEAEPSARSAITCCISTKETFLFGGKHFIFVKHQEHRKVLQLVSGFRQDKWWKSHIGSAQTQFTGSDVSALHTCTKNLGARLKCIPNNCFGADLILRYWATVYKQSCILFVVQHQEVQGLKTISLQRSQNSSFRKAGNWFWNNYSLALLPLSEKKRILEQMKMTFLISILRLIKQSLSNWAVCPLPALKYFASLQPQHKKKW